MTEENKTKRPLSLSLGQEEEQEGRLAKRAKTAAAAHQTAQAAQETPEAKEVFGGSSCVGSSSFGLTPEQGLVLTNLLFLGVSSSYRTCPVVVYNVAHILRALSRHRTIESSVMWRLLVNQFCVFNESIVMEMVERLFGDGPHQVSFVDLMRFEITQNRDQRGSLTQREGDDNFDELERWMLAEFDRLLPSSTPKDVAVMLEGLLWSVYEERRPVLLEKVKARFKEESELDEVADELKRFVFVGRGSQNSKRTLQMIVELSS